MYFFLRGSRIFFTKKKFRQKSSALFLLARTVGGPQSPLVVCNITAGGLRSPSVVPNHHQLSLTVDGGPELPWVVRIHCC